jgi:hypothetical protein
MARLKMTWASKIGPGRIDGFETQPSESIRYMRQIFLIACSGS